MNEPAILNDAQKELIDKTISLIKKAKPRYIQMNQWEKQIGCGTAYCVAGWMGVVRNGSMTRAMDIMSGYSLNSHI